MSENQKIESCNSCDAPERVQVSAYLDGELDAKASASFEAHIKICAVCAMTLAEQRRLLAVLDAAFASETLGGQESIRLPKNFAEVVTARAQTDMSGLSAPSEKVRALRLSVGLATACAFLLLAGAVMFIGDEKFSAFASATESILSMAARAGRDASAGGAIILRAVGGRFVSHLDSVTFFIWGLFACALVALFRLINSYRHSETVSE
jgi:anti-sigma factor RsiW